MIASPVYCGIDTSNYTTSAAAVDAEGRVLANFKRPLPVGEKACGLRQSDAVFAHIRNLPSLMQEFREFLGGTVPAAIGVSSRPRNADDSYMPCFLTGVAAAEAMSAACGAPLYRFSHQDGHIRAAFETSGAINRIGDGEFLSFHVSGGTTEVLHVTQTAGQMKVRQIGGTEDLNAGQAIDRTGVALGMQFPCGPAMEQAALSYTGPVRKTAVCVRGMTCNLSGLENMGADMIRKGASAGEVSAFVFTYIARVLKLLTQHAREQEDSLPVIYAGGVMSNSLIRSELSGQKDVWFTEPQYSADNAVGIALLCRRRHTDS